MPCHTAPDHIVLQRGWLSSNNIVFPVGRQTSLVDTGYCTHSAQTLRLVDAALSGRKLDQILNTHLHSDHCGGNAALADQYPDVCISVPPGLAAQVSSWDTQSLSYLPTGQECPRFHHHTLLQPGSSIELGSHFWEIHCAPGHDPHSILLFEPQTRTLISADALWENGFGVVFQELEGVQAFDEVASTLDLIARLSPNTVIPGHGLVFYDAPGALARARTRLDQFVRDPVRHARYGAKVLIKYKLLEWQSCSAEQLYAWIHQTPYFSVLHRNYFAEWAEQDWYRSLLEDLKRSQAIDVFESMIVNRD